MLGDFNGTVILILAAASAVYIFINSKTRTAKDVLYDLEEAQTAHVPEKNADNFVDMKKSIQDEYRQMGLLDKKSIKNFELKSKLIPIFFIIIALTLRLLAGGSGITSLFYTILFSFAAGVIFTAYLKRKYKEEYNYKMNFYLPLIMERLVMAVQAGQDILPAIGIILDVEQNNKRDSKELDPICGLLERVKKLSDAGLSFEKSLHIVAESVENGALRHAFIHLALAHKEGGELVTPLRELSDSTQLFYQETIEEEIAKMPVKATMPLLLTFAGLIICFITTPILQIIDVMQKAMP